MSIDVLQDKIRKMKNPSVLGLDPAADLIPPCLMEAALKEHPDPSEALIAAYEHFCGRILSELRETVPAVKMQLASFELLGASGIALMQRLMSEAKEMGYYVILDAMRGDVLHIAQQYADALFGGIAVGDSVIRPYACDGVTINAYFGSDSVKPYLPYCTEKEKAVFVAVKSSNKSGREVQDLISGDRVVHTAMADLVMRWSGSNPGRSGFVPVGAMMPATDARALAAMRKRYDRMFFLLTGYGAQGGTARSASAAFDEFGHGAAVSASRLILGAWKKEESDGSDFALRALEAAVKMKKDLTKFVTVI